MEPKDASTGGNRERMDLLDRLVIVAFVCMITLLAIGIIVFPYAPLHENGATYLDKQGHPHSAQYYWWFRLWERSYFISFIVALLLRLVSGFFNKRKKT